VVNTEILALSLQFLAPLVLAPFLIGVINRVKAFFAGRVGPPLLQPYWDLWKLLQKGAVYSRTTTWVFRAGPAIALAASISAAMLLPHGSAPSPLAFPGDLILFASLLGVARFFTVTAALDTGSSFEGMGASREVQFAALAEPALILGLLAVLRKTRSFTLSDALTAITAEVWMGALPALALVVAALLVVFLVENSRIPFDDPNTHLELTMVHEVMVLDHGGPDLAFILYGAAVKLWALGALLMGIVIPKSGRPAVDAALMFAGLIALAALVGVIESSMARLRLLRVPQLLVGATILSALSVVLVFSGTL
jgi:formate hydrogenlyase subunit 4